MTNIRKKGTFRAQAAERSGRAAQNRSLPPRCRNCRLPGSITVIIDGIAEFYCANHAPLLSIENNEWEWNEEEDK